MTKFHKVAKVGIVTAMALMPMLVLAQLPTMSPLPQELGEATLQYDTQEAIETISILLIVVSGVIGLINSIFWGVVMYVMLKNDTDRILSVKSRMVKGIVSASVVLAIGLVFQIFSDSIAAALVYIQLL